MLYFSVHEYDFVNGDVGYIDELGEDAGEGYNINFPIPYDCTDAHFSEFYEVMEAVLREFSPDLIIVATGFDMYFDDPVGNECLSSLAYHGFAKEILKISEEVCEGKVAFVLEGGYSLIGLPLCVYAVLKALLEEDFSQNFVENIHFKRANSSIIQKTKKNLVGLLKKYWKCFK